MNIRYNTLLRATMLTLALVVPTACGGKRVSRIDPTTVTDLSGRWNDTDSRLVANQLITESLSGPWARRYSETHGGNPPVVIVGSFDNRTMEHIAVGTFIKDLERAFVNSGAVRVVASKEERSELRDEKKDQQENANAESRVKMAQETGAKYMLKGVIEAIADAEGREKVVFYQVDATLIDLESNEKVWTGQHKIKKYIEKPRLRF